MACFDAVESSCDHRDRLPTILPPNVSNDLNQRIAHQPHDLLADLVLRLSAPIIRSFHMVANAGRLSTPAYTSLCQPENSRTLLMTLRMFQRPSLYRNHSPPSVGYSSQWLAGGERC